MSSTNDSQQYEFMRREDEEMSAGKYNKKYSIITAVCLGRQTSSSIYIRMGICPFLTGWNTLMYKFITETTYWQITLYFLHHTTHCICLQHPERIRMTSKQQFMYICLAIYSCYKGTTHEYLYTL